MPRAPGLPEMFSNLRIDCLAQWGPSALCANSWASVHATPLLALLGGWVDFAALACTGGGLRKPGPAPLPAFPLPHRT